MAPNKTKTKPAFKDNNQSLQERLHTLLTRLSDTGEILKKWPETKTGDDSSIHTRTTTKLINSIERIIQGLEMVEEKVNYVSSTGATDLNSPGGQASEDEIANKLRQIAVPLDLLDMMDFAGGVNPDCFARGLIKEAQRQMSNLRRRKAFMRLLASTIQKGMSEREKQLQILASLDEQLAASATSGDAVGDGDGKDGDASAASQIKTEVISDDSETKKRKRDDAVVDEQPEAKR